MISKGKQFIVKDKVYEILVQLNGYDAYYLPYELNRLISYNIVKKVRNASEEDHSNTNLETPSYPLNY